MEELRLTSEQERTAWEFDMELAFVEGVEDTPPPDAESWVVARPLVPPRVGGAACALAFA